MDKCVILGAGEIEDYEKIRAMIKDDDFLVCADGGRIHAEKMNLEIGLVIGDFDSSNEPENIDTVKLPVEKDVTDTFACIEKCIEMGYREFLLLGCTGGRLDHLYANILLLEFAEKRGCKAVLANERNRISVISENEAVIKYSGYENVSFFAFADEVKNLTIHNAKYQLENYNLSIIDPLCVSNSFVDRKEITVSKESGHLLMIESD